MSVLCLQLDALPHKLQVRSYNDHGEEGEAHEDTLHLDEQHGTRQFEQHGGVEAWDYSRDVCS